MPKPEKIAAVEEIKEKLGSARIAILTEFQGLSVAEMTELRKLFRDADIDYKIYKNTLTKLAAREVGVDKGIDNYLVGTTALAFGGDDLVSSAKVVKNFSAKHSKFKIKAGILNSKVIASDDVIALADIPPREVLLSMVLGGIQAPISRFLSVLQGPVRDFAIVLSKLADKKGEEVSSE